jgi:cytochrome P450
VTRAGGFPLGAAITREQLDGAVYPVLHRLRASEPVSWLPGLGGWLVTRRDLALRVLRDSRTFTVDDPRFCTGRVVGPSMLSLDGADHKRHRDPFAEAFRLGEVQQRLMAAQGLPGLRLDPAAATAPRGVVFRKPPSLHVLWDA